MLCLTGTVSLMPVKMNVLWTVNFPTGSHFSGAFLCVPFVAPSFQGIEQPFCVLQLASIIQGHQRRERGREKGERGCIQYDQAVLTFLFLSFILGSHHYLLCIHKLCSHPLSFLSFELSFPLSPVHFHSLSHLLAFSLAMLTSPFSLNSAVALGFPKENGCSINKWYYCLN